MNEWFGERRLLMISFTIGTMHNALYGLASIKSVIFLAAAIGSFAMMAFPTISAIKANNVVRYYTRYKYVHAKIL